MNSGNFFNELKRRNVLRAAGLYLVGAWLLTQVASTVLPAFDVPGWALRGLIITLALCFVPALVFSWIFELTPQGLKRDEDVRAEQSIAPQTARRMDRMIIVALALALGYFCVDKFVLASRREAVAKLVAIPGQTPSSPNGPAFPINAKSIAVLPFDNLSRDPENAYFTEGIQDEILTRLAKIAELKVISRTSTQRFKSSPTDLRQIAQQLGVTNILEGSVQRSNDQVRVNVQLINATTDAHLWAEIYDRKLTDIFAVESEIAKAVAETLQAKLTGSAEHVLASRPTENPEAHQLYLKGRYFWNKRSTENLRKSINYFQQAIERDPAYALAYAGLADARALLPLYASTPPQDDMPAALAAARKAVELDDTLAEAHTSLANAMVMNVQLVASEPEFRRAIELNPNYATAHQWFGECLQGEGRFVEALVELQRAHELDPLSLIINSAFGMSLGTAGRVDEAIAQMHKALDMDPSFNPAHFMLGQLLEAKGDLKGAIAEYKTNTGPDFGPAGLAMLAHVYVQTGQTAEARKILEDLTSASKERYVTAYPLAIIHLALGNKDEALRLLEKSYEERCIYLQGGFGSFKTDHRLDPLRGDPRFQRLLERFMTGSAE